MQHGYVINGAEGGLIIDFGCTTRRSEFVEVQLPHGTVTELLLSGQMRVAEPQQRPVARDDFVIRCCPLPAACWSEDPHWLGHLFKDEMGCYLDCEILCTAVLSQEILYLQRQNDTPLSPAQLKEVHKRGCAVRHALPPVLVGSTPIPSPPWNGRKEDGEALSLPLELLTEIFQALDSIERVRCRRVCPLWDTLLTSSYFPDVRVSGKDGQYGRLPDCDEGLFWVMAGLQKCLRPATKKAVIMQLYGNTTHNLAEPLNHTFNTSRRLPTLVFQDCELGGNYYSVHDAIGFVAEEAVQSVCKRMVWRECRIITSTAITIAQNAFSERSRVTWWCSCSITLRRRWSPRSRWMCRRWRDGSPKPSLATSNTVLMTF
ncbi:uncharacterized protein LOC129602092 [Paramacrobiotus metropolitanus]|uniref:uncharacterized protein LOC129602092 n=1 Tax=Paramacrobiotus metropolitanus TaxID=2943436 RepID=UPI0024459AAB|nr:uncharacterized protein LOC129602092 [Paramacrobiotus metropolitanus]